MTPDDKKRIEEIRSTIAARTMQAFAEGRDDRRQLELDAHFLLTQLDEALGKNDVLEQRWGKSDLSTL